MPANFRERNVFLHSTKSLILNKVSRMNWQVVERVHFSVLRCCCIVQVFLTKARLQTLENSLLR